MDTHIIVNMSLLIPAKENKLIRPDEVVKVTNPGR